MLKSPPAAFSHRLEAQRTARVRLASSLAAALLGTRRVLARQGWAGEKVAFLRILRDGSLLSQINRLQKFSWLHYSFSAAC